MHSAWSNVFKVQRWTSLRQIIKSLFSGHPTGARSCGLEVHVMGFWDLGLLDFWLWVCLHQRAVYKNPMSSAHSTWVLFCRCKKHMIREMSLGVRKNTKSHRLLMLKSRALTYWGENHVARESRESAILMRGRPATHDPQGWFQAGLSIECAYRSLDRGPTLISCSYPVNFYS